VNRVKAIFRTWLAARQNRHFLVAAVVLLVSTVGWNGMVAGLKWVTHKEPIPWPVGVEVGGDFRLLSLPTRLGPFHRVEQDGVLEANPDGTPDGEVILRRDVMDSLGVGTSLDSTRLADRRSNWYLIRILEDTRPPAERPGPFRYWQVEVYYYTGALDTVPHVPERCLVAGGATLVDSQSLPIHMPQAPGNWGQPMTIRRTRFEVADQVGLDSRQFVQYYVFSLNGQPEDAWEVVRLRLSEPWRRYSYFAKIQLVPLGGVTDIKQADQAAQEAISYMLPSVLAMLPTATDIKVLEQSGNGSESDTKR